MHTKKVCIINKMNYIQNNMHNFRLGKSINETIKLTYISYRLHLAFNNLSYLTIAVIIRWYKH